MIPRAIDPLLESQQQGWAMRIWKGSKVVANVVAKSGNFGNGTILNGRGSVIQQPAQREADGHKKRKCRRRIRRTWLD